MTRMVVSLGGFQLPLRVEDNPDVFASDRAALYHCFFLGEYSPMLRALRPGDCVIDAGANVGFFSILASKAVGPFGRIMAIEPEKQNFSALTYNLELNKCRNVTALRNTLSNESGKQEFIMGSGIGAHVTESSGAAVLSISLSDIVARYHLPRIRFLKMDIEGAEERALCVPGIEELLSDLRMAIIEMHSAQADEAIVAMLRGRGLVASELRREGDGPLPLAANLLSHPLMTVKLYRLNMFRVIQRLINSRIAEGGTFASGTRVFVSEPPPFGVSSH